VGAVGSRRYAVAHDQIHDRFRIADAQDERATIAVTVRAVNHRFLDLQLRVPQAYGGCRAASASAASKASARGRVEVGICVQVRDQVPHC
jgi:uncharacterized protein YicC (UPF0701 family)